MMKMLKKLRMMLVSTSLLMASVIFSNTVHAKVNVDTTYLEDANTGVDLIYPSVDFDIQLKINKSEGYEEYTYFDRETGEATRYIVKDKVIVSKEVIDEDLHPYSLLYKDGTSVVFPDRKDVYFSYVTLPDTVDYIYQIKTGKFSYTNCAPSTTAMIYNWANSLDNSNGITAQWLRDTFPSDHEKNVGEDGYQTGYTIPEIADIMEEMGLDIYVSGYYSNASALYKWLNNGYIISLSVEAGDLGYDLDKYSNIDRSYTAAGGHSIVCTGYLNIIYEDSITGEDKTDTYLEIIDPAGGESYKRYYNVKNFNRMLELRNCRFIAVKHN